MTAGRLLPLALLLAACSGEPPPPPVAPSPPPPLACEAKQADCNGDRADGCEIDLASSAAHCGACGHACAAGEACAGGACQPTKPRAVQVDVGRGYACAVLADGTVRCWGSNQWKVVTEDEAGDSFPWAARIKGVEGAVQVATAGEAACALRRDGTVQCWRSGSSSIVRAASNHEQAPATIDGLQDITALAAGDVHVCALARSGKVFCWGSNFRGVLGRSTETREETAAAVPGVEDAASIGSGFGGTCAIRRSGSVVCWGSILEGSKTPWQPREVPSLADAIQVSVGAWHACAVRKAGGVVCWGSLGSTRGGPGSSGVAREPVAVPGLEGATQVSAAREHSCALLSSGAVRCWGENARGALGAGKSLFQSAAPLPVAGLDDAVQVKAGGDLAALSCAVRKTGGVSCWGDNLRGGLGVGTTAMTWGPTQVEVSDATAVLAGEGFGCAAQQGGALSCWGWGGIRMVKAFSARDRALPPASAPLGGEVTALYLQNGQACALPRGGPACAFGGVSLEPGAPLDVQHPKPLAELKSPAYLASDLAVLASGELDWVPSSTHYFDLAKKKLVPLDQRAKPFAGVRDAVHAGGSASSSGCVVRRSGKVACWYTEKLEDLAQGKVTLVEVKELSDAVRVGAAYWGACALRKKGEVSCWSVEALRAQRRKKDKAPPKPPVLVAEPVPSVASAVDLSMGGESVCAVLASGKVACWLTPTASSMFAKLPFGNGSPQEVPGLDDALRVSLSKEHACVLRRGGKVSCWGDNQLDQTGSRADLPFSVAPVDVPLEKAAKP